MTVCPKCKGKAECFKEVFNDGKQRHEILVECDMCHGSGEIQMTNNEWRKNCSTEEFADFLNLIIRVGPYENEPKDFWEHVYGRGGEHGAKSIVEWLKKPHKGD